MKRLRFTSTGVLVASLLLIPAAVSAPIVSADSGRACYTAQQLVPGTLSGGFTASSEGSGSGTANYEPDATGLNDQDLGAATLEWHVQEAVTTTNMSGELEFNAKIQVGERELQFHGRCIQEAILENTSDNSVTPTDQVIEAEFEGTLEGSYTPPASCVGCPTIKSGQAVGSIVINAVNHNVVSVRVTIEDGKTCADGPASVNVSTETPNVHGSMNYTNLPPVGQGRGRIALPGTNPCTEVYY